MSKSTEYVQLAELKRLVESGAVREATLVGLGSGLALSVSTMNGGKMTLREKRGALRVFASPLTAMKTLRSLGIATARLDIARWEPTEPALV